jgi:hypothetical protein
MTHSCCIVQQPHWSRQCPGNRETRCHWTRPEPSQSESCPSASLCRNLKSMQFKEGTKTGKRTLTPALCEAHRAGASQAQLRRTAQRSRGGSADQPERLKQMRRTWRPKCELVTVSQSVVRQTNVLEPPRTCRADSKYTVMRSTCHLVWDK